jgi:hypothetical protein
VLPRDEGAGVPPAGEANEGGIMTMLRVVRGNPTGEELAALIAVVASRGSTSDAEPAPARSLWGRPVLRSALPTGPGAWRASTLPR